MFFLENTNIIWDFFNLYFTYYGGMGGVFALLQGLFCAAAGVIIALVLTVTAVLVKRIRRQRVKL